MLPGPGGVGDGELLFSRYSVSVWDNKKVPGVDVSDGHTTV